jgi:hypothetical protein
MVDPGRQPACTRVPDFSIDDTFDLEFQEGLAVDIRHGQPRPTASPCRLAFFSERTGNHAVLLKILVLQALIRR